MSLREKKIDEEIGNPRREGRRVEKEGSPGRVYEEREM